MTRPLPFSWEAWGRLGAVELAEHVRRRDTTPERSPRSAMRAAAATHEPLQALVELFDKPATAPDLALPPTTAPAACWPACRSSSRTSARRWPGVLRENGSALHRGERTAAPTR